MRKIKILVLSLLVLSTATLGLGSQRIIAASNSVNDVCASVAFFDKGQQDCGNPQVNRNGVGELLATVVKILSFVGGVIALIMIIIGGVKYTTSQGDHKGIESAKNTILYSLVGLILAILAPIIVTYVTGKLG